MLDVDCHCFDLEITCLIKLAANQCLSETVLLKMAAVASLSGKLATGIFIIGSCVLSALLACYVAAS